MVRPFSTTLTFLWAILSALPAPASAESYLSVEIVVAKSQSDSRRYSLTGEVRARDTLSAAFPTGGRIAEVLVEAGAKVTKGAALARMQAIQQEQALRAAEAGHSTALADYQQAAEDLARQETLLSRGATTRIGRDSAEDALRIAEGGLTQAQADLDRAQKALADTVLSAPSNATVTARHVEAGQVVGAAQPVMALALGPGMDAVFEVPEVLFSLADPPSDVELHLIGSPTKIFMGHVTLNSPVVDAKTGTVEVTVAIDNPPDDLTFGEAVRGSVTVEGKDLIVLPFSAMSANATGPAVWQVNPETMAVTLTPITIDRFETGRILISDGIADGALIVGRGAQLLYPGRVVQPAREISQ